MINIQENLKENIIKVFERLREEGKKGYYNDLTTFENDKVYPVKIKDELVIRNNNEVVATSKQYGKFSDKDYREYMKWLQVLESLVAMLRYGNSEAVSFDKIEEEVLIIQNTMRESLDNNLTKQYACLVRCYEHLLRILRMKPIDSKVNVTYTRSE